MLALLGGVGLLSREQLIHFSIYLSKNIPILDFQLLLQERILNESVFESVAPQRNSGPNGGLRASIMSMID